MSASRRHFIQLVASAVAGAVAVKLPALPLPAPAAPDEWADFLERVRARVMEIVQREQRGLRRMWIEPPRADGVRYTRRVHIELEAGRSLLDRLHFDFIEVSGSRLTEF